LQTFADVPLMTYNVEYGNRYRFRLINAASNVCSFIVKFENHNFTVIASDGSTFQPTHVDSLHITSGERYDIVVEANKEPRDYMIQIKAYLPCAFKGYAIMRYRKDPADTPMTLAFADLSKFNETDPEIGERTFNTPKTTLPGILLSNIKSSIVEKEIVMARPDHEFYLFLGTPRVNNTVLFNSANTIKWMGEFNV
jgi:FtsP/CotA-like multicopper oxidase with cupredoxin domain